MATPAQFVALTGGSAAAGVINGPADVAGLVAWYDFSNGAAGSLYTDITLTTRVVNDGDQIAGMADRSGNSYSLTQATGASRPLYKVNQINGLSAGLFAGVNAVSRQELFRLTTPAQSQPLTVLAVVKWTSTLGMFAVSGDGNGYARMGSANPGTFVLFGGSGEVASGTTPISLGTVYAPSFILNGASSQGWINGVSKVTGNPGSTGWAGLRLGAFVNNTDPLAGLIGEVLVYSGSLSATSHNGLGQYLATKWGLTWTTVP
jgi:hypothetical protein